MNIFHLIKSLGRGGAERLLPETLRSHDRDAFAFAYGYFLSYKDQLVPELERLDAPVYCFASANTPAMLLKTAAIARFLDDWGADLIHAHLPMAGVVARRAGRRAGIPVVYTEHNVQERYHPLTRRANLWTMAQNDRIICVSENAANSLKQKTNSRLHERITILPNGVNTRKFSRETVRELPVPDALSTIPTDTIVIGTVAVFRKQKRLDRWVELARRLAKQYDKLEFILVGDGPLEKDIRRRIYEEGLDSRFHLPGRLDDVRPWLQRMDIYLITSEHEGMPVALLEAMSMERAVVTTDAGGITEVIRTDTEGLIRSPGQGEGMFAALCRMLENEELRRETGKQARDRVVSAFSIEHMARNLEQMYVEVLKKQAH